MRKTKYGLLAGAAALSLAIAIALPMSASAWGGKGHHGIWSREGLPSSAGAMVSVTVITAEENLDAVLEPVFTLVKRHIGIVTVSDVTVLRPDRF